MSGRDNSLNFVRLLLASAVIVGHTWPIGGFGDSAGAHVSAWAVNGFFGISGFLIAGSRWRTPWVAYLWRRFLRIFPAFWSCLLLTAFVFAPVGAALADETWSIGSALTYVIHNLGLYMQQQAIDHTLQSTHYPHQWNGSLWTLAYEFAAYLMAAVVMGWSVVKRHKATSLWMLWGLVALTTVGAWTVLDINNAMIMQALRLAGFFAAGMALWSASDRIPVTIWLAAPAAAVSALLYSAEPVVQWPLATLPFTYLMLWLGSILKVSLGSRNDISYGVYIYAFPVQQLLATVRAPELLGFWGYALAAFLLTLPLAASSWFWVERPSMKLRSKFPIK